MIEGLTKEFEFIFCQKILFSFKKKKRNVKIKKKEWYSITQFLKNMISRKNLVVGIHYLPN